MNLNSNRQFKAWEVETCFYCMKDVPYTQHNQHEKACEQERAKAVGVLKSMPKPKCDGSDPLG